MPVVAAVNGVAAGAGANLALNCDLVIAARSASFIQAFAKIGLVPDTGGTWLLPRLVGRAQALGLAMLGDKLPAEQAERIGLIWKCVDDAALAEWAVALPRLISAIAGWGRGDVIAITYEYGNTFLIVSGLLNALVALDVFDRATGRKPA